MLHLTIMRDLLIILFAAFLSSCKESVKKVGNPTQWTEEQKRKYFADNFSELYGFGQDIVGNDSTKTFLHFFTTQYPDIKTQYPGFAFPYAFEEEYVDTAKIDSSRLWFRLIVKPSFRRPFCFVVEKKDGKVMMTIKITNGSGGSNTGLLIATIKSTFEDTLYHNLTTSLNYSNFWNLGNDATCP